MSKTIMIVGAGFGQVPAILRARELGLRVVAVDRDPCAPGMGLSDAPHAVDIIDREAVLGVASKEGIDGAMTLQSDHGVPAVGYVNDMLGLKGVSYRTAMDCSIKSRFRERLRGTPGAQPAFFEVDGLRGAEAAVAELGLPVVVKATDSSGSRGITKVSGLAGLAGAVEEAYRHTRQGTVLVEEYIEGVEFGAQTFSVNGRCELVLLHNDTLSPAPYMVPIGHSFPFVGLEGAGLSQAVEDIKGVIEALGIEDGPANVDVILDGRTKRVKVIEVGARIGATCLPELVRYHTGIDWVGEAIKSAVGEGVCLEASLSLPVAARIVEADRDGVFESFSDGNAPSGLLIDFEVTCPRGSAVSRLRKGTDRIGRIVSGGVDARSAELFAQAYHDNLRFNII